MAVGDHVHGERGGQREEEEGEAGNSEEGKEKTPSQHSGTGQRERRRRGCRRKGEEGMRSERMCCDVVSKKSHH